ncbi:hypothetical protein HK414_16090 [Ramlibacter terrae]|uniref:Uncharacterized protein n=1 Tax=Ramlibacter terrae TaxID=2732511 RepID=A0ABX6P5L4_9BURK|nr:hypothetical protein HK414_16090 [Ramlibacter terrae]
MVAGSTLVAGSPVLIVIGTSVDLVKAKLPDTSKKSPSRMAALATEKPTTDVSKSTTISSLPSPDGIA